MINIHLANFQKSKYRDAILLFGWVAIGAMLRFLNLGEKPPWTDEFATLVFSLGNTFQSVPLDQVISSNDLLQPLVVNPQHGVPEAIESLINEDHHPPIFFALANLWSQLSPAGKLVDLGVMRSLPAFLGVLGIPAIYFLARLAFAPVIIAHLTACLMAVSPYGVFISQEARHYTAAVLFVIASLSCLVIVSKNLIQKQRIPWIVSIFWIVINVLGMGVHYFFALTLIAEIIALIYIVWRYRNHWSSINNFIFQGRGILLAILGTGAGSLVWIQLWLYSRDDQMTEWIKNSDRTFLDFLNPIAQSMATWTTMLYLLPIEGPNLIVMIIFIIFMVFSILAWMLPLFYRGIKQGLQEPVTKLGIELIGSFVIAAIGIFFAISYFLGMDITRGARYNFVYFPAIILGAGAGLYYHWQQSVNQVANQSINQSINQSLEVQPRISQPHGWQKFKQVINLVSQKRNGVILVLFLGFCSGLTVATNLAYQKYYRPDFLIPIIQANSQAPILIATTHQTLVQTGEMMGIAWEWSRHHQAAILANSNNSASQNSTQDLPQYLLAHQQERECFGDNCTASIILQQQIAKFPSPVDVWLVNFQAPVQLDRCISQEVKSNFAWVNGYGYQLYRCN
jgi:uncharacterized membrane protein